MLKGDKVILRAMRPEDLEKYTDFRNDVELALQGGWLVAPAPYGWIEADYRAYIASRPEDTAWFGIETQGKFIGQCLLHHFDHAARSCELGITIGDRDFQNRGYGRDAVRLLVKYAFRLRNIQRVWLSTGASNERAIKAFQAAGFEEEGRLRRHVWLDGRYDDLVYMGILREDAHTQPAGADDEEESPNAKDGA
ncbi:MAG: GNAT family N-acetyltransferase [Dehalococcoidia bacterium]|nr:GNAT family N-acetyltransferase [Dehalococcoidia bacterium]